MWSTTSRRLPQFTGKLVFSMGCHAGLSVPDDQVDVASRLTSTIDPRLDIAQAMAARRASSSATPATATATWRAIAGTVEAVAGFANQATTYEVQRATRPAVGVAFAAAKRQYFGSLLGVTPYEEKTSVEFTMYGMPQYRFACDAHAVRHRRRGGPSYR